MDVFIVKLILTFIVGSVWVTYSTIIAEKLGSKIGGLLAGIPSTTVISLFFIGWTQTADVAVRATTVIPLVMGVNAIFIGIYTYVSRTHFKLSLAVSLFVWFISSIVLVLLRFNNFFLSLSLSLICIGSTYIYLEYILKIKSQFAVKYTYSSQNLLFRGLLSGLTMTIAVVMARVGGPILGGAFSSFPAVVLSTMIITHSTHGWVFSAAVMKSLMLSVAINVVIYTIAVRYSYPWFGLYIGTLVSFFISLISAYTVFRFIKKIS